MEKYFIITNRSVTFVPGGRTVRIQTRGRLSRRVRRGQGGGYGGGPSFRNRYEYLVPDGLRQAVSEIPRQDVAVPPVSVHHARDVDRVSGTVPRIHHLQHITKVRILVYLSGSVGIGSPEAISAISDRPAVRRDSPPSKIALPERCPTVRRKSGARGNSKCGKRYNYHPCDS